MFEELSKKSELDSYTRTVIDAIKENKRKGDPWSAFPRSKNFHNLVEKWVGGIKFDEAYPKKLNEAINLFQTYAKSLIGARSDKYSDYAYTRLEVDNLILYLKDVYSNARGAKKSFYQ